MILRSSPRSPYVRKVRAVILETGLESRVRVVTTDPWAAGGDFSAQNPLGKVPTLLLDDGSALYDSKVICAYLDTLHGGPRLYPEGEAHFAVRRREALVDGLIDAAVGCVLEGRRPVERRWPNWVARQQAAIRRSLAALEAEAEAEALAGALRIDQIALGVALGYLDFRLAQLEWREGRPRLAAWYEGFALRPSMRATVPPAE